MLVAATVMYSLPADTDWDTMRALTRERAVLYVGMPGLRSKAFVIDPATRSYGGHYLWESRAALDDFLRGDIVAGLSARFGEPEVHVYEATVVVVAGTVQAIRPE